MFEQILLDTRAAVVAVLAAAVLEALGRMVLAHRVWWSMPARGWRAFLRKRLSLAAVFVLGVIIYSHAKDVSPFDPFFEVLYTFLVSFALFFYATSLASVLAASLSGLGGVEVSGTAFHLMATLVLLGVVVLRPQASLFGFFSGAAAHLAADLRGRGPKSRWGGFLRSLGVVLFLLVVLSILSR